MRNKFQLIVIFYSRDVIQIWSVTRNSFSLSELSRILDSKVKFNIFRKFPIIQLYCIYGHLVDRDCL